MTTSRRLVLDRSAPTCSSGSNRMQLSSSFDLHIILVGRHLADAQLQLWSAVVLPSGMHSTMRQLDQSRLGKIVIMMGLR